MANQFLIKETMQSMKALGSTEITALEDGTYNGVQLLGYHEKGDTPAPIIYYLVPVDQDPGPEDEGSVIDANGIKLYHDFTGGNLDIRYFGVADTPLDNYFFVQKAFDYADGKGCTVIIPKMINDILLSNTVTVGTDTIVDFKGSFLKLQSFTTIGTVLINKQGAKNITLNNPLIDGNNIVAGGTGENGISFLKCKHVRVYGGVIKNCKKGAIANKLGGKAIQVESTDCEDVLFDGTYIENSSWAFSTMFDIDANLNLGGTRIEVTYNNIIARNCTNVALLHQTNGLEASDNHIISINNITAINCGNEDGLIIVSRLKNAKINGCTLMGSVIAGGFVRGRHSNCSFKSIKIFQNMNSLIWNEPSFHGDSARISENNIYDFELFADIAYLLNSTSDNTYAYRELIGSRINVLTNKDNFNFSLPQAAHNTTSIFVKGRFKEILINSTDAILSNRNNLSSLNQNISIGSARKLKTGNILPNNNVFGDAGDIYLQEINSYSNVFFKYFGVNTNTGWGLLTPLLNGTTSLRPGLSASSAGQWYFDTTIGRPIIFNGIGWVDPLAPATISIYGVLKKSASVSDILNANSSKSTVADAVDLETALVLLKDLKTKYNQIVDLTNELKSQLNAKFVADRASEQQAI
ncbi:hypothetical protein [Sphingobacterium siyangense]|uniref:hypothetical protein n=1 Tax=Sphingobacterium siyangense TaxID=459529 RepID=UPI003DA1F862